MRRQMGDAEIAALTEVIRSGVLGRHGGTKVLALEQAFAKLYGVDAAIACSSGTSAVHIALGVVNPEPGDEIITTPCSDFGTVAGILFQNAIPIFADLDPQSFCLDPASVESLITDRTKAIVAVNLFGGAADLPALRAIADRHGLILIEDCAQMQLTECDGRLAGTYGHMACFSLNSSKHLNCGEGGVVITSDKAMAQRARLFADKGWPRDQVRHSIFLGNNYRMNELEAAVALVGLERLAENVSARRRFASRVQQATAGLPGLIWPTYKNAVLSSYWLLHVLVAEGIDLDQTAVALQAAGADFKPRYVAPLYTWPVLTERQTYGQSGFPFDSPYTTRQITYGPGLCPTYEKARERLLLLTMDEQMTDQDADRVAAALMKVLR